MRERRRPLSLPCVVLMLALGMARPAAAALGDCGQPNSSGTTPTATDALFILNAAVGLVVCELCVCDVDGSRTITATDALRALQIAVGGDLGLNCPPCGTGATSTVSTSTSSTTSTTSTSSTTTMPVVAQASPGRHAVSPPDTTCPAADTGTAADDAEAAADGIDRSLCLLDAPRLQPDEEMCWRD